MKNLLEHLRLKRSQATPKVERAAEPIKPIEAPHQPAFIPPTTPRLVRPAWHAPSVQRAPAQVAPPTLPEKSTPAEMITLTLGDFLDRIPGELLDPKKPDPSIPMPFDIGTLSERMARGNTMVSLGELFRRIPDIFRSDRVIPLDRKIVFPWSKVLAMVEQSRDGAVVPGLTRQSIESLAQKLQARKQCRQSKMAPLWGGGTPAPHAETVQSSTEKSIFQPVVLPPPIKPESTESIQATVDDLKGKLVRLQKSHDEIVHLDQAIKAERDDANRRVAALGLDHERAIARIGEISAERDAAVAQNAKLAADGQAAFTLATELSAQREVANARVEQLTAERDTATARVEEISAERDAALKKAAEPQTATARPQAHPASVEPSAEQARIVALLTTNLEECLNTIQVLFREREAQHPAQQKVAAQVSASGAVVRSTSAATSAEASPPTYLTIPPQPGGHTNSRLGAALALVVLAFGICAQHPFWQAQKAGTKPLAGTATATLAAVSTAFAAPVGPSTASTFATPEAFTDLAGPPAPENPTLPKQTPADPEPPADQAPADPIPEAPPSPTDQVPADPGEATPGEPAPEILAPSFTAEIFAEEKFTLEIPGAHESARMLIPKPLLKIDTALH